jgi:hypothetical protein
MYIARAKDELRLARRAYVQREKQIAKLERQVKELQGLPLSDSKETT